jgi:hypothetical protein
MTRREIEDLLTTLSSTYDGLKLYLQKKVIRERWLESFQGADGRDVQMALNEWIETHSARLEPTINDLALRALDIKRARLARVHQAENEKALRAISAEDIPSPDSDIDRVWVEFHLHWVNKGLNKAIVTRSSMGKRAFTPFPWEELKQGYRDMARRYPQLAEECSKALALYGE